MQPSRPARWLWLACSALVLAPVPASATSSQAWVMRSRSDFGDARLDNVTISPEGRISLSPEVSRIADSPQPVLWCLAIDSKGIVYAGGGNDGQVLRAGTGGMEVVLDTPEVEVHAIAIDATGRVYAGSSPDGKVYRVTGSPSGETFFDPQAKYVWAMAFDPAGNLLVATGQPGRIYRVNPAGKGEVLLEGREDHIRTLAPDGRGGFYAGSDQGGVIYHITPQGKSEVLFDTPAREIPALALMDGDVYAAALTPTQRGRSAPEARGPVTRVRVTAEGGGEVQEEPDSSGEQEKAQQRQQPVENYSGAIYRISPSGYARKVWESREALPLSLLPLSGGRLLVGTSVHGRVVVLGSGGDASDLATLQATQVNALAAGPGGTTIAATSNLGALFRIGNAFSHEGTVMSDPKDAGFTSKWGTISWDADTPAGAEISFQVRTGDTEEPDTTWSEWSKPYAGASAALIDRREARYLQWRATLKSKGSSTPVLRAVEVHYLPENMPPEIESVDVQNPGVSLQPTGAGGSGGDDLSDTPPRRSAPPKRSFQRGMRSVTWKSSDANGDPLKAEVQYRAEDETAWKTLETGVEDDFYAWDSTAMPDGVYRIRVLVSDAAANPPGKGFTGQRESAAFDVDNTPPSVSDIKASAGTKSVEISAVVSDSFSVVGDSAYSVDAGDWTILVPEDGIADSARETYRFTVKDLAAGEHSIVIRARDRAGNVSSGKAVVRIP